MRGSARSQRAASGSALLEWAICFAALAAAVALLLAASDSIRQRWWVLLSAVAAAVVAERVASRYVGSRALRPAAAPGSRHRPAAGPSENPPVDEIAEQSLGPRISARTFQVAKSASTVAECEDAIAVDEQGGAAAIADGASSAFMAREWAALLAASYVSEAPDHSLDQMRDWAERAALRWADAVGGAASDGAWWTAEAEGRGSYATFLGFRLAAAVDPGSCMWEAVAIGDACVAQLRLTQGRWTPVCVFPVTAAAAFDSFPDLVSTGPAAGLRVARIRTLSGEVHTSDRLLLATDALAQWALAGTPDEERWAALVESSDDELTALVNSQREQRLLVDDDVSLVVITVKPAAPPPADLLD